MTNTLLTIIGLVFAVIELAIAITALTTPTPFMSKWVTAPMLFSVIMFVVTFGMEFFLRKELDAIEKSAPPLSDEDVETQVFFSNRFTSKEAKAKLDKWKLSKLRLAEVTKYRYLHNQQSTFCLGVISIIVAIVFYVIDWPPL